MRHLNKPVWLVSTVFGLVVMLALPLRAQEDGRGKHGYKPKPKPDPECNIDGFSTTVTSVEQLEGGCTRYTYTIETDGTVRYELSHYTVEIPCGTVQDISNSRNWKQEIGKDPTTGLTGFKIDDIKNCGKEKGDTFTVTFIVCGDSQCTEPPTQVAYKAGQCIKIETLEYPDDDGGDDGDNGGGDDGDDDGDDDDNGGGDDDGGNGGGGDDDNTTCSTLLASLTKNDILCAGANNGQLSVTIEDGNQPITFKWSTGATTQSIQNLSAGTYAVTVTDADGNTLTLNATIAEPQLLSLEGETVNPSCSTSLDGSITTSVAGGSGTYSFLWSTGATTQSISGLNAGTFSVTVTDEAGCTIQKSFQLMNTTQINLSAITTKTTCAQATGAVDLTVTGGASPYTFVWSNGATTEDLQNVATGSYRVVVTDANGCQTIGTYFVQEVNNIRITFQVTKANCNNDPVGAIDVTVAGGVGPYTYQWQHGPSTEDVSGLIAGTYRVTVTDQTGCASLAAILVQKENLQINAQVIQPKCADDPVGSIQLTPLNGVGPFTYEWSNGSSGSTLIDAAIGTYIVVVTDAGTGCSTTLSYTLSAPSSISAESTIGSETCGEEGSFSVSLSVTGGRAPYQILWSNGSTGPSLSGLSSGIYTAQIRDVNGCEVSKEVTVGAGLFAWECIINPPAGVQVCQSVGNSISSTIADADSYSWSLTSSDASWSITSGQNAASAIYSIGNANSTATFTLTVIKGGCQKTCSFELTTSCEAKDNTGGGNPGSDDPCAQEEPTEPDDEVPVPDESDDDDESDPKLCAYPNPFVDRVHFDWKATHDDYVRVEIYDQQGRLVKRIYDNPVSKGEKCSAKWDCDDSNRGMFFYRYVSQHHHMKGRVVRR